jgi:predicted GIY-YIG superfamily endonuclease
MHYYVYLLRSINSPEQTYIGLTNDLELRLKKHNSGGSPHTSRYKQWKLVSYLHSCNYVFLIQEIQTAIIFTILQIFLCFS